MSTPWKEIIAMLVILVDERKESFFFDTLIEKGVSMNSLFALLNIHMDDMTIYTIIFGSSFFFFPNCISAVAAVESLE